MSAEPVLTTREGPALLVTINRPEAMNAVNAGVATMVGQALDEADHDPEIRVVIITGSGDKAFCAGADLKAVSRGESIGPEGHPEWGFAGYVSHFISKPTIAAVNGFALGGGTELCLASDLVVASAAASFGLPEVSRGILAAAGGAFRLPRQLPRKIAMELILTGRPIDAEAAAQWGFVNRVVPPGEQVSAALELAAAICRNAPLSVQASKRIAYGAVNGHIPDDSSSWALTRAESSQVSASEDAKEGPRAFAEKRTPVWKGR